MFGNPLSKLGDLPTVHTYIQYSSQLSTQPIPYQYHPPISMTLSLLNSLLYSVSVLLLCHKVNSLASSGTNFPPQIGRFHIHIHRTSNLLALFHHSSNSHRNLNNIIRSSTTTNQSSTCTKMSSNTDTGTDTGTAMNTESSSNNYWNRETSSRKAYSTSQPITQQARIICVADPHDDSNQRIYDGDLPEGATVLAVGSHMRDFDIKDLRGQNPNVIFCSHGGARELLSRLIQEFSISWIHSRSAGIDVITSPALASSNVIVTNAKGCYR